jgi:predicted amidohydrolase YtcJ
MGVRSGFGDDHLKFGAAKMFADGGMGARTIAIYPPGVIGEPDNLGVLRWKAEDMQKAQLIAAAAGWQLETHAIGDRAIDQVLDSYAKVTSQLGLKDLRFRIVHGGISTPAVQKRMRQLNVIVDGNPPFVYRIGGWFTKYGPDRVRWSYPAKSYIENGIIEAAGSDVDVTPLSPWWGLWAAVVRKDLQTGQVLAPEERITEAVNRHPGQVGYSHSPPQEVRDGEFGVRAGPGEEGEGQAAHAAACAARERQCQSDLPLFRGVQGALLHLEETL